MIFRMSFCGTVEEPVRKWGRQPHICLKFVKSLIGKVCYNIISFLVKRILNGLDVDHGSKE